MVKPIKADYVTALQTHLEQTVWSRAFANIDTNMALYQRNFALWPSKYLNRPVYHSPRPTAIVNHAVNTQINFEPVVTVTPWTHRQDDEDTASRLGRFWKAFFVKCFLKEPMLTPRQVFFNLVLHGIASVQGVVLEWDPASDKEPAEQIADGWWPFRIRAPAPKTVLLHPRQKHPQEAMWVREMYVSDIDIILESVRRKNNGKLWRQISDYQLDTSKPFDKLKTTEYTTPDVVYFGIGGVEAFQEENAWRFQPFAHGYSGWGTESPSLNEGPETMAVGILEALKDTTNAVGAIKRHDQAESAKHNLIIESAFHGFQFEGDIAQLNAQLARGGNVQVPPGKEVKRLPPPVIGAQLEGITQETLAEMEFGTYTSDTGGYKQPGVDTVGQQRLLSNNASLTFIAPNQQMDDLFTIVAQNGADLVRKMIELDFFKDGVVRVGSVEAKASDFKLDCTVAVTFAAKDAVTALQNRQMDQLDVKEERLSKESYWERNDFEVETERKRLEDEQVDRLPAVAAETQAAILKQRGMDQAAKIMEEHAKALVAEDPLAQAPTDAAGMMGPGQPQGGPPVAEGPGEATIPGSPAHTAQQTRAINPKGMGGPRA